MKSVQETFIVFLHIHQRKCSIMKRKHHIFWVELLRFYFTFSTVCIFCRKFCKVIWCSSVNSSEFFYDHFSLQRSEFNIIPLLNVSKDREECEASWALQCCVIPEGLLWVDWATPYYFAKLPTVNSLRITEIVKSEELDSENVMFSFHNWTFSLMNVKKNNEWFLNTFIIFERKPWTLFHHD